MLMETWPAACCWFWLKGLKGRPLCPASDGASPRNWKIPRHRREKQSVETIDHHRHLHKTDSADDFVAKHSLANQNIEERRIGAVLLQLRHEVVGAGV